MTLNGNTDDTNGYNSVIKNGEVADADLVKAVFSPIGSVTSWLKTFGTADSGTTNGTTTSKLVDSTQTDFLTTVSIGMIVHNTTDNTFANVTAIDSNTILSLDSDIMVSGKVYIIYKTPQLPDGWVECDGSVLSDSDSPYNGETIPDLNNADRFLRGNSTSGGTGGATSSSHKHLTPFTQDNSIDGHIFRPDLNSWDSTAEFSLANADMQTSGNNRTDLNDTTTIGDEFFNFYTRNASSSTIPPFYSVVWIMRVK